MAMALAYSLCLITISLLFCSAIAQPPTASPVSSPKKSSSSSPTPNSSSPTVSAPSPSKTPKATAPSPSLTVETPPSSSPSPVTSQSSISEVPAEAPGPAENSAVLNRFGAAGSVAVGLTALMFL